MKAELLVAAARNIADATEGAKTFGADPFNHAMLPLYATVGLLAVSVLVSIAAAITVRKALRAIATQNDLKKSDRTAVKRALDQFTAEEGNAISGSVFPSKAA